MADTTKKYFTGASLETLVSNVKSYADQAASSAVADKAPASHTHDDRYYTESEIDNKLSAVNTSITNITNGDVVVKEAEHAESADEATHATSSDSATHATTADSATSATTAGSATSATKDSAGNTINTYYETKTDATAKLNTAKSYTDTEVAKKANVSHIHAIADVTNLQTALDGKASTSHKHDADYDTKGAAADALASAKTYADNAANTVKNDLLNGAGTAYDTLKELGDLIDDNKEAIDALEEIASGKANATHSHAISDVSGLQSALDGKAASSHGTHVTYSTTAPVMDGAAAVGTATTVARSDHKHPTDTSRASKTEFDTHVADTTKHITSTERTNWNAAKTHADSAHAPSNAQANVIESIKVNGTAQTITSKAVDITVPTKASDIGAAPSSHGHAISDITDLQTALTNAATGIQNNTSSISGHTTRIEALETKVGDGFSEITSAEIQALFA